MRSSRHSQSQAEAQLHVVSEGRDGRYIATYVAAVLAKDRVRRVSPRQDAAGGVSGGSVGIVNVASARRPSSPLFHGNRKPRAPLSSVEQKTRLKVLMRGLRWKTLILEA